MTDVTDCAVKWIEQRIRDRWPKAQQVKQAAENFDAVIREYEIPHWKLLDLIAMWPRDKELLLDNVKAWAKAQAEERDRILERVPKL